MARTSWTKALLVVSVSGFFLLAACAAGGDEPVADVASEEQSPRTIELTSAAFDDGAAIPSIYTCDGEDVSPPLQWRDLPAGAVSLALIMDDPDAPGGTWVHWVVYDMPASTTGLSEGVSPAGAISGGGTQGNNSWNRGGYGGPCPPGGTHRYFFTLYALDDQLGLGTGAQKEQVLEGMAGHMLGHGQLMGTYERQ